jgi:ABC-type dipeptide/oligopeptide/nickel transport system permease component
LVFVHAFPNALVPLLTVLAVGVADVLGGAPVVETVFTWPGIGRYTVQAIAARDVPVVQGFTLIAVLIYVLASLIADLCVRKLDPRRMAGEAEVRRKRNRPWIALLGIQLRTGQIGD